MRIDNLLQDFTQVISDLLHMKDEFQKRWMCYAMWNIWRARKKLVIEGQSLQPQWGIHETSRMMDVVPDGESLIMRRDDLVYWVPNQALIFLVDASWDLNRKSGLVGILYDLSGNIQYVCCKYTQLGDPFQVEVTALKEAMLQINATVNANTNREVFFFSDCQNQVFGVNQSELYSIPSWRARQDVQFIIDLLRMANGRWRLVHARSQAVEPAHKLPNQVRRMEMQFIGRPDESFVTTTRIELELDCRFFRRDGAT